jgi:hypothetical protein
MEGPSVAGAWNLKVAGETLGVALDLDAGTLFVSFDGGEWTVAFPNSTHTGSCRPSDTAGAALFPALSGSKGAWVRCNWGADAGRPMRHTPPSEEYCAVGLPQKVLPEPCRPLPCAPALFFVWCRKDRTPLPHPFTPTCDTEPP